MEQNQLNSASGILPINLVYLQQFAQIKSSVWNISWFDLTSFWSLYTQYQSYLMGINFFFFKQSHVFYSNLHYML